MVAQPATAALRAERHEPVLSRRRPPDRHPRGNIAFAQVQFTTETADIPSEPSRGHHTAQSAAHDGFRVELGGSPISAAATAAPGPSEGIGITAAILIMLLAFGSVVAMGLPIITALVGLGVGVACWSSHACADRADFLARDGRHDRIGVGIDYALFIVTRYRQGIFEGRDPRNAVVTSLMTSGRSVLFAGSTVVISLFGLFLIGQAYMIGLAVACIAAVLMVLIAALTLLPAMLGSPATPSTSCTCPRLLQTGGPPPPDGFWYRWSRLVQRGPGSPGPLRRPRPDRAGPPVVQHAARLHRRQQRPARRSPQGRPTTCWRRGSARASTARSSSRPTCSGPADRGHGRSLDRALAARPRRRVRHPAGIQRGPTGAVITSIPTSRHSRSETETLVKRCATTSYRPSRRERT